MELIFELSGGEQPVAGQAPFKTFKQAGGLIGRADHCDWIILDKASHVSSQHARITFDHGEFYLTDLSTNGTQILPSGQQLRKGETHLIEHGNQYRLGKFEMVARLVRDPAGYVGAVEHSPVVESYIPDDAFLDLDILNTADHQEFDPDLDELLPSFGPQQASQQGVSYGSADTQNLLIPELVPEQQTAAAVEPASSLPQSEDFWTRFADAVGVDLNAMDQEHREAFAVNVANLLKQSISGLQQTLRTRSELKNELRLALSMAQHSGNNPLKYAGDASEAIGLLLNTPRSGQLSAERAVTKAFRDIQAHQVAMLTASRAALRGALEHFAPQQLSLRFERDARKPRFFTQAKRWQAYERHHQTLCADQEWSERLLARDFAQAYEEQVRLLATLHIEH